MQRAQLTTNLLDNDENGSLGRLSTSDGEEVDETELTDRGLVSRYRLVFAIPSAICWRFGEGKRSLSWRTGSAADSIDLRTVLLLLLVVVVTSFAEEVLPDELCPFAVGTGRGFQFLM